MKKVVLLVLALFLFSSFTNAPFKNKGKNVVFTIENIDESFVSIIIHDSYGRVIYKESSNSKEIKKKFIFEDTCPGIYTIKIKDGDIIYSKVVKIKS